MNLPNGHFLQNGKYRIMEAIGQGGFGITYKSVWKTEVQGPLGKVKTHIPVCIKEFFFKDYCLRDSQTHKVLVYSESGTLLFEKFKEKLISEARILSDVHHPHIVNVLEVFEENNTAYIVMEYIQGYSLKNVIDNKGILPEKLALGFTHQIGDALSFVHQKQIIHLDIKPSNILIDRKGQAKLIDFGVSKRYDIDREETSTTMLTVSKGYASIEQYDDEGIASFSPRPDIYSLGATLYTLVTGKLPVEAILRVTKPLEEPRKINPQLSKKTESVILKAMSVDPDDRYESIDAMLKALDLPTEEEIKQVIREFLNQNQGDTDERTRLITPGKLNTDTDEDATVLNTETDGSAPEMQPVSNKKKNNKRLSALLFLIVLLGGAGTYAYFYHMENLEGLYAGDTQTDSELSELQTDTIPDELIHRDLFVQIADSTETKEQLANNPDDESAEPQGATAEIKESILPEEEKKEVEQPIKETSPEPAKPTVNKEHVYDSLVNTGKQKYARANYAGAIVDYSDAKKVKLTEEIVRLFDEATIQERKSHYDLLMKYGDLTIVKKKLNDGVERYGAINMKAEEVIPCQYKGVGRADIDRRAFVREDNLVDIYDRNGKLVLKEQANY